MKQYQNTKYQISETGQVYNTLTNKYITVTYKKEKRSTYKRAYISLSINRKQKWFTLARLVAQLYVPNPNNYKQVNHIDGNPLNNHYSNLEWVTQSQNITHAIKTGLKSMKGINNTSAKLTLELVKKAIEDYNTNQYSLRDLATKYNVSYTTIRYAIKGKTWQ